MDSGADTPQGGGLPHSEIHGSKGARPSPRLFAACHVLHRLSVPRHPPNALRRLISAADKTALARLRARTQRHRGGLSRSNQSPERIRSQKTEVRSQTTPNTDILTEPLRSPSSSQCPIPMRHTANGGRRNLDCLTRVLPSLAVGGGGRDRTDDLKLAKLALSQLSYAPS